MRRRALVVAAALAPLAVAACAHRPEPKAGQRFPAPSAKDLPPPDSVPGVFTVRQKLTARSQHGGGGFEAVLQKRPGEILLLGLTPYGSRAFLLRQTAGNVEFTSYIPRELPFPPTFILLDVHRVLGTWLPGPPAPERTGDVAGERIRERWQGGKLVERTFTRVAGDPPGEVKISYSGAGPNGLAAVIKLDNLRFGYSLTIESYP